MGEISEQFCSLTQYIGNKSRLWKTITWWNRSTAGCSYAQNQNQNYLLSGVPKRVYRHKTIKEKKRIKRIQWWERKNKAFAPANIYPPLLFISTCKWFHMGYFREKWKSYFNQNPVAREKMREMERKSTITILNFIPISVFIRFPDCVTFTLWPWPFRSTPNEQKASTHGFTLSN